MQLLPQHWAFSLWRRKSETFCVCPFALHRQQPEKDKQNVDFSPLEKFLRTPMVTGASNVRLRASRAVTSVTSARRCVVVITQLESDWSRRVDETRIFSPFVLRTIVPRN